MANGYKNHKGFCDWELKMLPTFKNFYIHYKLNQKGYYTIYTFDVL